MIGCWALRAWVLACRPGELSQQPTRPHSRQIRRCSQRPPVARQSSQPSTASGSSVTWTWSRWVQGMGVSRSDGERDVERRAARFGVEGQRAVVAIDDDASRGGEAEAAPTPDVLGRVEGLEDAVARLGRDARAVVADVDERARVLAPGRDRDRAAAGE